MPWACIMAKSLRMWLQNYISRRRRRRKNTYPIYGLKWRYVWHWIKHIRYADSERTVAPSAIRNLVGRVQFNVNSIRTSHYWSQCQADQTTIQPNRMLGKAFWHFLFISTILLSVFLPFSFFRNHWKSENLCICASPIQNMKHLTHTQCIPYCVLGWNNKRENTCQIFSQ